MARGAEGRGRAPRSQAIEEARVRWLARFLDAPARGQVPVGIGDDAAVWRPRAGHQVVLTSDVQAEGTHFAPGWLTPREIGCRSVTASISDLAAMAAGPAAILVSVLLESTRNDAFFRELFRGIREAARAYGARVVGGNMSRGPLSVTVTAIGEARPGKTLLRGGLEEGDEIWVTGSPGLARLGLLHLSGKMAESPAPALLETAVAAFKEPRARVREALALRRSWRPHAAIDLSDGLAVDLGHLADASAGRGLPRLGIELSATALASLVPTRDVARAAGLDAVEEALRGGEDYELCLAVPPGAASPRKARSFERRFGVPITRIGRAVAGRGVVVRSADGSVRRVDATGFQHYTAGSPRHVRG